MLQKPPECGGCVLENIGQGFARPEGSGSNGVLLLGEKLGFYESRDSLPFRPFASAGNMLEVAIDMIGARRQQFRLFNARNCYVYEKGDESGLVSVDAQRDMSDFMMSATRHCSVHRTRVIEDMKPRVICAMGAVAMVATTGMVGRKCGISHLRGYPIWSTEYGCWVVPTYNPQFIQKGNKKLIPLLVEDLRKAVKLSQIIQERGSWAPKPVRAVEYPSHEKLHDLLTKMREMPDDPFLWIVYDIELNNAWDDIASVQFSFDEEDEGVYCDWNSPHREFIKAALALQRQKVGHNVWRFDNKWLTRNGVTLNGVIDDTLWMYNHFQPDLTIEEYGKKNDRHVGISSRISLQSMCSLFGGDQAWKHLDASQPRFYGCMDVINNNKAARRLKKKMLETGQYFAYGTHASQEIRLSEGLWGGYATYTRGLEPYIQDCMQRGLPISREKLEALALRIGDMRKDVALRLQETFPHSLKSIYPEEGFAKAPKTDVVDCACLSPVTAESEDGTRRTRKVADPECPTCLGKGERAALPGETPRLRRMVNDTGDVVSYQWWDADADEGPRWRDLEQRLFELSKPVKEKCKCLSLQTTSLKTGKPLKTPKLVAQESCPLCAGAGHIMVNSQTRWCMVKPFTGSTHQLQAYIAMQGYEQPLHRKTKQPTTSQMAIERLAREYDDPIFNDVIEYRTLDKMKETYCAGWMPSDDGFLHAEIGYATGSGQMDARDPNVFAIPKRKDISIPFQQAIEAKPGHLLVEFDFSAFHAVTTGFIARDKKWIEVARRDPHSFLTAIGVGRPVPFSLLWENEPEYVKRLKAIKKEFKHLRDGQYKPAWLGYGFDMGAGTLYENNKAYDDGEGNRVGFESKEHAQETLDLLDREFPVAAQYRKDIKLVAASQQNRKLISHFGFVRWFWEVFGKKFQGYHFRTGAPTFKTTPGEDAQDSVAFLPSNIAHGHFRDVILRLGVKGMLYRYGFSLPIHDALIFHVQEHMLERCVVEVKEEMERPSTILIDKELVPEGLSVGVEAKFGRNRAPWHAIKNPDGMRDFLEV